MTDGVVEVEGGLVQGVERRGVWSFSGIPYAAPPTGSRRWRPPAPAEPWTGIRACDQFGPVAPQAPGLLELSLGGTPEEHSEDCLFLNVWTPAADGAHRPVMVWIHGGSYVSGSGSSGLTRGGLLAGDGDVVVVTINYRLGLLGFLAHPVLADPDQSWLDGDTWTGFGNWGLADQVAALRWVRDNIAGFGGDPGNVTLFGESAGGMGVSTLLAVPAAKGLFHRAIVESGPPYVYAAEQAGRRAEELAAHLGVPCTRQALEQVPAEDLVRAVTEFGQVTANNDDSGLLMMPVVDGGLLPAVPEDAVRDGSAADIPLLIGTNRDEGAFFAMGNPKLLALDDNGLVHWLRRLSADRSAITSMVDEVREARLARGEPVSPRDLWVAIASEFIFRLPSIRLADTHASAARPGVGTYVYLFTWASQAFGGILGSCHALEIPFVFGTVHHPVVQAFSGGGEEAFALSAAIRRAWTAFAHGSDPSTDEAPWPTWEPGSRPTMVLGPWPGRAGNDGAVDRPRDVELEAVGAVVPPRGSLR